MKPCPYLEFAFNILGRKWNGMIIHYLSKCENCASHFTSIKEDLDHITPKALSIKLTELINFELIDKVIIEISPLSMEYKLTEKGMKLAKAMEPIQQWAAEYGNCTDF